MSEPDCGSDVAAIKTRARPDGAEFVLTGQKMWLTNGARAGLVATLVRDELGAESVYRNMTTFLIEKEPGFGETRPGLTIPGKIDKMGYKGVETTEMVLDDLRVPASAVLGGADGRGRGFYQMMDGIEVGRVNVAARGCGVAIRAFELGSRTPSSSTHLRQADRGPSGGGVHPGRDGNQGRGGAPAHGNAVRLKDSGARNDVEAGMAKLLASEYCVQVAQDSFRIHGGYGYSKEYEIERLMRKAPFLLIGEGTSEIQKLIISRGLLREYRI